MTHTVRTQMRNELSVRRTLWLEPWGEDYGIDPDEILEIVAKNVDKEFYFLIDIGEDIKVWAEGQVVDIGVYKDGALLQCGYKRVTD